MKNKLNVLIVDSIYKRSENIFSQAADLNFVSVPRDENTISEKITEYNSAAVVLATDQYTQRLYNSLPEQGLIARYGVGHDGIDKNKATDRGQFVTVTPGVLDNSVAEHAIFLAGSLAKKIPMSNALTKNGQWKKTAGFELAGKTILIIGCGAIGKKVAKIASFGFRMKAIGYDIAKLDRKELKNNFGISELVTNIDDALARADVVSVHLPAIEATKNFIGQRVLSKMKNSAIIVNTSRGSIVDENALYDALADKQIAGAGLDVFKKEPYEPQDTGKDLRTLDNTVLTAHLGSSTTEASDKMAEIVIQNIRNWSSKEFRKLNLVNKNVLYP